MYQIICDGYVLHDLRIEDLKVLEPSCDLEVNKTGSLKFKIHESHPYYDKIKKHKSEITLIQENVVLFSGRVLNDEIDFNNTKLIECEGELAYFLDSVQRPHEYHLEGGSSNVIDTYLRTVVTNHNNKVDDYKKFGVGIVTVSDPNNYLYKISNYEDTLTTLTDKLLNTYGGYFLIRHTNEGRVLDYLADFTNVCNQVIEFGKNIIDMNRYIKGENIVTVLIPLGSKINENESEERLTIASLPNADYGDIVKNGDYLYSKKAVEKYGWIEGTKNWDDVTIASNLLSKGKDELLASINETLTIELTAIDLHILNVNIDKIRVGDKIRCISKPHGIDTLMLVKSMSIDIVNPQNTTIKLTLPEQFVYNETSITNDNKNTDKNVVTIKEILDESIPTYDDIYNNNDLIKDWVSENYLPNTDFSDNDSLTDWANNNYLSNKDSNGNLIDLSSYAKITDVNSAFSELASALNGV